MAVHADADPCDARAHVSSPPRTNIRRVPEQWAPPRPAPATPDSNVPRCNPVLAPARSVPPFPTPNSLLDQVHAPYGPSPFRERQCGPWTASVPVHARDGHAPPLVSTDARQPTRPPTAVALLFTAIWVLSFYVPHVSDTRDGSGG
jgi:hypothetical protein